MRSALIRWQRVYVAMVLGALLTVAGCQRDAVAPAASTAPATVVAATPAATPAAAPAPSIPPVFAYVPNQRSGTVSVIDTHTDTVVRTLSAQGQLGKRLQQLLPGPHGHLYLIDA
ncbi:surface antigen, partial [Xanthomonas hortorum pv. gardneri]